MAGKFTKGLSREEFNELERLVDLGKRNFSDKILENVEVLHPLNLKKKHIPESYVSVGKYIFQCAPCEDMNFPVKWYQIILESIGGSFIDQKNTKVDELRCGYNDENLSKIPEGDTTDFQMSSLNYLQGRGYICDHCKDCGIGGDDEDC